MEPIRLTFWNVPPWAEIAQYLLGFAAAAVFLYGLYRHIRAWRMGKPEAVTFSWANQLKNLLNYALMQRRLFSDPYASVMHLTIFWGMFILLVGTALATVDWDFTHLLFDFQFLKGNLYLFYELILDLFSVLLMVGLGMAAYRRYGQKPERLSNPPVPRIESDSFYLLLILGLIGFTGLLMEGFRIAVQKPAWGIWSPVGYSLAAFFQFLPISVNQNLHFTFWGIHAGLAFVFIATIPYTKAFHLAASFLHIGLKDFSNKGALTSSAPEGIENLQDLTWKQLVQLDACTWCGRCQEACPAYSSGFPLSPRDVVIKLAFTLRRLLWKNGKQDDAECFKLHNSLLTASELWSCTTCMACEEICPVLIEHPRMIIELRRYLITQGVMDKELQDALTSFTRYGNSFGKSDRMRTKWSEGLEFKIKDARKEAVEYLWYVGDYASFDPRMQEITRKTARLFNHLGVDFGILYQSERNSGNDVRRAGEEGLFDLLKENNLANLQKAQFTRIVTSDPHTFHTLKNEYGANGIPHGEKGKRHLQKNAIYHSVALLEEWINQGRLPLNRSLGYTVTYHDPCYLGRYNGIYEPPRRILDALGIKLMEFPRNRDSSFCCGAGGSRIWMKDMQTGKERPAVQRIREALALKNITHLVVACPKDLAMFQDAVKTVGVEKQLQVVELGELIYEAVLGGKGEKKA